MAIIQQALLNRKLIPSDDGWTLNPSNACFNTNGDDRLSNSNNTASCPGIPDHTWQQSGTHMVSDGGDNLIPDHRTNTNIHITGRGTNTLSGGYPDQCCPGQFGPGTYNGEASGQRSTDNGTTWSESGISNVTYTTNQNYTTWYGWDTNGSTSSPVWMVGGGGYPNYNTSPGNSKIALYKSTNHTSWSRLQLDPYVPPAGQSQPTGQTIADIAYSNGAWVLMNSARGVISRSTNNGSSWSSWATPVGTNWSVIQGRAIKSNNGGSKIVMSVRGDTNNSWKQFYYSSDSGASWNSGTSISTSFGTNYNDLMYFDGIVNVGNTQVGPGVWVAGGSLNNGSYGRSTKDLLAYSTNGTSWTEIDVQNDVTPSTMYRGQWGVFGKIIDIGDNFITVKRDTNGAENYYISDRSLTDWRLMSTNPFVGTTGSTSSTRDFIFQGKRLIACSGMGSVMSGCAGRIGYIDFV
jgi:hypothetical protein